MVLNGHHKPKPAPPSPSSPPPPPLIGSPKAGSALYERARKNGELHVLPGGLGVNDSTPTCGFYRRDDARAPELADAVAACTYLTWRYVGRADVLIVIDFKYICSRQRNTTVDRDQRDFGAGAGHLASLNATVGCH